jgi:uncharacterized protein YjbI with pentapeptide repeats
LRSPVARIINHANIPPKSIEEEAIDGRGGTPLIAPAGREIWNQWRKKNPTVKPYLREAVLRRMDLSGANLREANLRKADLSGSKLVGTDLRVLTCLAPVLSAPI